MRIHLRPMEQPSEGVCIGTLDGRPLFMQDRHLHCDGQWYQHAEVADAYVEAVDRAASAVFGSDWVTPLARLMQINRRSTAKDRIAKFGLPEYILLFLANASSYPVPRALGYALLCVEAVQDAAAVTETAVTGRPLAVDVHARSVVVSDVVDRATGIVDGVLAARDEFRNRKPLRDGI